MCEVKPRNFSLSLKLDVAKPKRQVVKQEVSDDSFYESKFDDEKGLDSAVDFFSLPTPDLMKKFPGIHLNLRTAPNTPTVEEREFEQTSLSLIPDVNLEDNNLDFLRTPQPSSLSGSLQTPIVDPNFTRNPLIGHLTGLAPSVSHETINCAQQQHPVNPTINRTSTASPFTTHYSVVSPSYNTDESCSALSSSTSSFIAPSTSQQYQAEPYNPADFHELRTRSDNVQEQAVDSLPTVIPDHVYSYSPSASVASPGSVLSHDSTSSDTYSRVSPQSGIKRKQSQDSTQPKKPRMTKKQQFVELQNREKFLQENIIELRRRVEGMTEGCKKLKQLLMQKLSNAP